MKERFDLSLIATRDRIAALDELGRRAAVPFHAEALDPDRGFRLVHDASSLRRVDVTQTTMANVRGLRSSTRAAALTEPRLVVAIGTGKGSLRLEQNDHRVTGEGRFLVPFWSIAPWALMAPSLQTVRAVSIPLDQLGFPHLLVRDMLGRNLGGTPLADLFARHVGAVVRAELETPVETGVAAQVTIDLFRSVMSTAAGEDTMNRPSLRETLGNRIVLYMQANITDSALTPGSVAAVFGISRRYLYLTLSELGLSFADIVRRGRLHRAAEALTHPGNWHVTIGAIGGGMGFPDQSSFTRAFKNEFGCTPTEWRNRPGDLTRPVATSRAHPAQNVAPLVKARRHEAD